MDKDKPKWQCPICGDKRYQKYGGLDIPVIKITKGKSVPTTAHLGQHFMCKGCSVFFSNPRLFNTWAKND